MMYNVYCIIGDGMKRVKYVLLIIVVLLSVNVNAKVEDHCEKDELARLKELAKKVEFDYEYKMVDGKPVFTINAVNLNEDLKVLIVENYYSQNYKQFKGDKNNRGSLDGFSEGERVKVTMYGFVPNWCSGKEVYTKTVKLPYYNYYYSEEKCKGYEGYKYCRQLTDVKISEQTFENGLATYKKNKEKQEPIQEPVEDNTKKYILIGVGSAIVGIAAAVLIIRNVSRIKKRNSL